MSRECPRLLGCEFFQKYQDLEEAEIDRLKSLYCKGPYVDQCVRKMYKDLHAHIPNDNITPEGKILSLDTPDGTFADDK